MQRRILTISFLEWVRFFPEISYHIMSDYEKLEYIHFAIQEAMNMLDEPNPELENAIAFVEELREPFLTE